MVKFSTRPKFHELVCFHSFYLLQAIIKSTYLVTSKNQNFPIVIKFKIPKPVMTCFEDQPAFCNTP